MLSETSATRVISDRKRESRSSDPARLLYDEALEVLEATGQLSAASGTPGSAAAVPSTLRCVEASLRELARAVEAMRREAQRVSPPARHANPRRSPVSAPGAWDGFDLACDAMRTAGNTPAAARESSALLIADR